MKRKIIVLIVIVLLLIFGISFCFFYKGKIKEKLSQILPEEKTLEEILKDLTALSVGEAPEVPEGVIKSLTAPGEGEEVSEEILQSLTAPK